jgi:hypothetical protein
MIDYRMLTAYHEAGHVVAALEFDCFFARAELSDDPVGHTAGRVLVLCDPKRADRLRVETILRFAGPVAEAVFVWKRHGSHSGELHRRIAEAAMDGGDPIDSTAMILDVIRATYTVVSRRWQLITALAAKLLASPSGAVDFAECLEVFDSHGDGTVA